MKISLIAFALLVPFLATSVIAAGKAARGRATVFVGTYTDTTSRGIYRFTMDLATGETSAPVLAVEARNPSFLALHPSGRFLYAVGESYGTDGQRAGAVNAFSVDPASGELALLNQQPSGGAGPCHLVVDRAGSHVLVANYGSGTVAVLPVGSDGRLGPATSVRAHEGSGPNAARQAKPHAHGVYLDAAERFALVPDLGADRVFVYAYDAVKSALDPHGVAALDPGAGPRHLAFDPAGRRAYVINELTSTLTAFDYDAGRGTLRKIETVSTLPAGYEGTSTTAEVAVSQDGRFAYGSNRGHDSLAVFRVEKDGRLKALAHVAVGGKTPRHFAIDPSGRWLLAAHQDSDSIAVFRLDPTTGMPVATGAKIGVGKPVCVLFVTR